MRIAVPAAAAVIALVGTGIAMSGSQAAEAGELPKISAAAPKGDAPSNSELRRRAIKSIEADARDTGKKQPLVSAPTTSRIDPKIIGGTETPISSAPWMAQLHFFDDKNTADTSDDEGFFCGGAVVAPSKIVTAGHCVKGAKWYNDSTVIVGTDQLPTKNADGSWDFHGGQLRGAYRQWNHPSFSFDTLDNDVAVLTLTSPVTVKPLPIMQPTDTAVYTAGTKATVYGWGRTSSTNQDISQSLKQAELPIRSNADCGAYYGSEFINGHMVCVGEPASGADAGTVSPCNGDSGGPLVVGGKLVGVVSWGVKDCVEKGAYSVFAKMSTYSAPVRARVYDANWSSDHAADLLARRASDSTLFGWTSKLTSLSRTTNHGNFGNVNLLVQNDLNRDDYADILYRIGNGDVYWDHFNPVIEGWESKLVAKGWGAYKQVLIPGDLTGDDLPDMMTVNSAGNAYLYAGKGNGGFAAPVLIGAGWGQYSMVRGHGDFTGDGRADILARGAGGATYLYAGTGKATGTFAARRLVGTFGSTYNALVTTGDVNSDGNADLLVRDTAGKLWLYPGNGKPTGGIFATRLAFGTGWQAYNLFG